MARQDFWITVTETTSQSLNAVAVAEIAHVTQQVHRHLGILHTQLVPVELHAFCVRKIIYSSLA